MPQSSRELRERWNGPQEETALSHLIGAGYDLTPRWTWIAPEGRTPTDDDMSAIRFLIEEWDFGGLES